MNGEVVGWAGTVVARIRGVGQPGEVRLLLRGAWVVKPAKAEAERVRIAAEAQSAATRLAAEAAVTSNPGSRSTRRSSPGSPSWSAPPPRGWPGRT